MNQLVKQLKNRSGITLIALIVSVIILMILASISIGALKDNGIIGSAKKAKLEYEDAQERDRTLLNSLLEEENRITCQLKVNTDIQSFNATLGDFTIVLEYVVEKDGIVCGNDVIEIPITDVGEKTTNIEISVPKEAVVKVKEVYHSPNYDLQAGSETEKTIREEENKLECSFTYVYNGKLIESSQK